MSFLVFELGTSSVFLGGGKKCEVLPLADEHGFIFSQKGFLWHLSCYREACNEKIWDVNSE